MAYTFRTSSSSSRPSGSQQQYNNGSQQQYNSGSQQLDQIMDALNAILHAQEAIIPAIERIPSVHGTPRQQQTLHKQLHFTYETFTDYLTNRLATQLEERARLEAPILLLEFGIEVFMKHCYHSYR